MFFFSFLGKLITSIVTGIAHRRPQGESYDQAIRNDTTGLWQCPFCQQDNFPELSEVQGTRGSFFWKSFPADMNEFLLFCLLFRCGITLTAARVLDKPLGCGAD